MMFFIVSGFFVAALCDSFTTASCLAIGSYFPLFMLSGKIIIIIIIIDRLYHLNYACKLYCNWYNLGLFLGAIWPLEGMHYVLRVIAIFLPITSSVEAYRSISVRSWSITYYQIYISLISLVVWTTIFAVLTIVMVKFRGMKNWLTLQHVRTKLNMTYQSVWSMYELIRYVSTFGTPRVWRLHGCTGFWLSQYNEGL